MRIEIQLFAVLRERAGTDRVVLEDVPEGTTVAELKELARAAFPALGDPFVAGVVGTSYASPETVIEPGDEVALLRRSAEGCRARTSPWPAASSN